jgi:hypothetical protein
VHVLLSEAELTSPERATECQIGLRDQRAGYLDTLANSDLIDFGMIYLLAVSFALGNFSVPDPMSYFA